MRKVLKWLGFVFGGVLALLLLTVLAVYLLSWRTFSHRYSARTQPALVLPTDAAAIAAGEHLANVHGCIACHGNDLQGGLVFDVPYLLRAIAPNLTDAAARYTPEQLATVIRQGIRPDGTSVWIMPSAMFRHLSNADLARILAFVRSRPARDGTHEVSDIRVGMRAIVAFRLLEPEAQRAAELPSEPAAKAADEHIVHGRYLALSTCTECHGQQLEGMELEQSPPLLVVKGYSLEDFTKLMRTGVPLGGRHLRLMDETAASRFTHFTDQEIGDLYAFLQSR